MNPTSTVTRAAPIEAGGSRPRRLLRARSVSATFSPFDAVAEVFRGVEWTPAFIAFLYYYFVIVTYYLPGADYAMVASVALLVFQIDELRIGRVLSLSALRVGWAWISFLGSQCSRWHSK